MLNVATAPFVLPIALKEVPPPEVPSKLKPDRGRGVPPLDTPNLGSIVRCVVDWRCLIALHGRALGRRAELVVRLARDAGDNGVPVRQRARSQYRTHTQPAPWQSGCHYWL